jgi:hypothetical protein
MNRRLLIATACAGLLSASAALSAASAAGDSSTAEDPTPAQLADLSPSEVALLDSGAPIDVVMDPPTGDIISVATPPSLVPDISNRAVCDNGDGCYLTNKTPYADEGFYGSSGTYYGTWVYRSGYSSGSHTVSACWIGSCGVEISPGSRVTFTSDVTGTSFTIY